MDGRNREWVLEQVGMEKYLGSSQGTNYAVQPLLLVSYRYVMGPGIKKWGMKVWDKSFGSK
jgi:hypothetical protein